MTDPFFVECGTEHSSLPVVLLHGFCETHALWNHYLTPLSNKYRVLCPDLPGFGMSSSLADGFSLSDIAVRMVDWLQQLGIEKCILIGHSLGGYIALAMLEQQPSLIAGLGLFHSTAYADGPEKRRTRNNVIDFVEKHGVEVFSTSFVPQLFYHTNRSHLTDTIDEVVAVASTTPQHTLISYTRAMQQRPDRLRLLEQYKDPILYIIGEKDTSVSLEDSQQQLKELHNCEAYVLENTGHMGMYEQETECLLILSNFIDYVQQQKNS